MTSVSLLHTSVFKCKGRRHDAKEQAHCDLGSKVILTYISEISNDISLEGAHFARDYGIITVCKDIIGGFIKGTC